MQKLKAFLSALLLAGCTTTTTVQQIPSLGLGETTEAHLIERYNDTRVNCGAATQPAFLCNGVLIRGTDYSPLYNSWDNSPNNHRIGGVSFSYLRRDSKYTRLAYGYDNGYIFLPVFYIGAGKLEPEILCAFPIDAATVNRTDKGCGASSVTGSGPCQTQNIYTAAAWYNHYRAGNNSHSHQCGFDVRDALNEGATSAFDAMIKGMTLISTESFTTQNELRIAVWPEGSGTKLPLEAFFYVNSSKAGLSDAQNDQIKFKTVTGISLPVISLWLPKTPSEQASFKYIASDQRVPLP
ncbi:MAG TPA: hypothetical protein VF671_03020 [Pseudomonas sp.]|jgi:hypothetical protein|uniref:hypothetical protein n=1 Tax=Pseudomonas sp. TaxID=306 RepID=UPI002ED7D868